jgi:hypothetical protein
MHSVTAASHAAGVDYKQFTIKAFERSPGKWRARIGRVRPKPSDPASRKLQTFVTAEDSASAADALKVAMEKIDVGAPHRPTPERYWRPKRGSAAPRFNS